MKMTRLSHLKIAVLDGLFYVLFLGILGMLGMLAHKYPYQSDWTFGNRNTLSESTQQLLQSIKEPLEFVAYVPDKEQLQSQLKKHINKYQRFKPDTTMEIVNPELEPARAEKNGIQYQGQVLVRMGDRQEIIESLSEHEVANVLQRLSRDGLHEVIFLEGHEERQPLATNSSGMSKLAKILQGKGFHLQPHNLLRTQSIPENTRVLVIASPQKEVPEGEIALIKKYLEGGGNLLWLHEPGSLQGLAALEEELGIIINEGTMVDSNKALRELLGIKHPAVVPVLDYNSADIASGMSTQTLFPLATSIERDSVSESNWSYQDFLMTLPTSWLEVDELQGNVVYEESEGDISGPLSIGISMTRELKQDNDQAAKEQRVVVVGDSDFMLNAFVGQVGNLELSIAIFNWLSNDDDLISINATGAPDTRLELPSNSLIILAIIFLVLIPLASLLLGFGIWFRRRKR